MVLERNIFFSELCFPERIRFFLFKQLELSEGTSRALRILTKARQYLTPKPEEDLDSDSAEEHSDIPEQSSESSSDDSSSETSESSCESYNVDEDESSEKLSSEKKQKLHQQLKERQVHPIKFHQTRRWYWEKAFLRSVKVVIRPH